MGEAKRRKAWRDLEAATRPDDPAKEAPAGAQYDASYDEHRNRLRGHFPRIPDKEIGLAWMRSWGAEQDLREGRPEEFPTMPGHVVMHLICERHDGASLSGAVPVDKIDDVITEWKRGGQSRRDTRDAIFAEMQLQKHLSESTANSCIAAALAMAFTSEAAPTLRLIAADGNLRLIYFIERFLDGGRKALNFRLVGSDQRDPFPPVLPVAVMPPTTLPQD